jgi:hypothetical protein
MRKHSNRVSEKTYNCSNTGANARAYVSIYTKNLWDLPEGIKYVVCPLNECDDKWLEIYMYVKYRTNYDERYGTTIQHSDYSHNFDGGCNICGIESEEDNYFYIDVYKSTLISICRPCIEIYNDIIHHDLPQISNYKIIHAGIHKNQSITYLGVRGMQGYILRQISPAKYIRCLRYKKSHKLPIDYSKYSKCTYCDVRMKREQVMRQSLCKDCGEFLSVYCKLLLSKTYWLMNHLCEDIVIDIRLLLICVTVLQDYQQK